MAFQRTYYEVNFILAGQGLSQDTLHDYLKDLGKDLEISVQPADQNKDNSLKIHIQTENPHLVFDTCSLFGKLDKVKIDELKGG